MKIVVTYEQKDLSQLIKQDLARQGIEASDADIKYVKGQAVVSVEASTERPLPAPGGNPVVAPQKAAPVLEAIEGGNAPVDMGDVLSASERIAAATAGKYNPPKRVLLPGESYDWPGSK